MPVSLNIVDAAQAIMDGEFGIIEDIKIGDLMISSLTGLDGSDEMEITERSVQAGFDLAYAATRKPRQRTLEIVLANPGLSLEEVSIAALTGGISGITESWRDKKDELYRIYDDKERIEVQTHENLYKDMMIELITPYYDVNEKWDAFLASVTVKEIKILGDVPELDTDILDSVAEVSAGAL